MLRVPSSQVESSPINHLLFLYQNKQTTARCEGRLIAATWGQGFCKKQAGFFDGLISFFVNLWMSFMKDYNNVDVTSGSVDNIDIWVGRGIEYCEILREQIKIIQSELGDDEDDE